MASVSIKFGLDAQNMLRGAEFLADTVAVTLGCAGECADRSKDGTAAPRVTKDGVTVADTLEVAGRHEQMGLRLMRRAGQRVGEEIGDGTSTTIVLARALAAEGLRAVAAGHDPMALRLALQDGVVGVVSELRRMALSVRGRVDYERIATISAHGESELGATIAEAFDTVGIDGVVSVEGGGAFETTWEKLSGLQWEGGYVSPIS